MDHNQISITNRLTQQTKIPRWLFHLGYWFIWVLFWSFMWGTFDNNYAKTFHIQLVELPFKILLVYPVMYYLMPRFLLKAKYTHFLLSYIIGLLIVGLMLKVTWSYYLDPLYFPDRLQFKLFKLTELLNVMISLNTAIIFPFAVKITGFWMYHYQKSTTLERDKLQAELKFLRTQVNPHFLFNALNSLYALSLSNNEKTTETIAQLADIMRYIIYEASVPEVSFEKEITFIKNYIEFEKVRISGDIDLSLNVDIQRTGKIPPLLFIPLIENAFKHLRGSSNEKPWIVIQLEAKEGYIKLYVENSYEHSHNSNKKNGIGLENLDKRLEILYPETSTLRIIEGDYSYQSVLEIFE